MATIYRFIVEQKASQSTGRASGRKNSQASGVSKKTTAKKGRWVSVLSGDKGGVEHNRKMRAINPLLNKMTGGYWEKGMRLGRAGAGLVQRNTETGALGISAVAIAIIISFVIQTILKIQRTSIERASRENTQNFKALENGVGAIHGQYEITTNLWNGKISYNENK